MSQLLVCDAPTEPEPAHVLLQTTTTRRGSRLSSTAKLGEAEVAALSNLKHTRLACSLGARMSVPIDVL